MSGADIHTVAQLLGQEDLRMAARYQHLSPAFLSDAVRKLDGVFGQLSAGLDAATRSETEQNGHPVVTAPKALPATMTVSY